MENCENCNIEIESGLDIDLCETCYEELYCLNCGIALEEEKGNGMCRKCDQSAALTQGI